PMKIAIATKDFRQIAGHAGQSRHWLLYEGTEPGTQPRRIELAPEQVFHVHRDGVHPLDGIGVVIAGSAGDGFLRRMGKRGVTVALTAESDPARAQRDWLAGCLAPPAPPGLRGLICKLRDRLFSAHLRG
ncbi:hypothetical protein, partial [Plasticicumulans sp.]